MTVLSGCPTTDRLRALLDGVAPEAEQAELNRHLETCEMCQQAIEALVAGKESWAGAAAQLEQVAPAAAAGGADLARAIDAAKQVGGHVETQDSPHGESSSGEWSAGEVNLDFLQSSDQAGSIGRLGQYEVLAVAGRGGFGVVLKAFDTSLRRVVAIKVLAPHLATNGTARRRFVREGIAAASVVHDHVVTIHAVDGEHSPPFLVMQFIEGRSLQERIDRSGPMEVKEILRIAMQTAAGLAAAHAQGHVHRDIKPSNILLENGVERVKITDFGLARAVDDASLTQSGVVAGTPQYMAPEQASGEAADYRSDLFSLGSVLYAMCTGRPPFRATTAVAVLKRVCDETPRPIREINPDIPEWLEAIIAKLHAKRPADRFQSAAEVRDLLGVHLAHLQQPTIVPMPPRVLPTARIAAVGNTSPTPPSQTAIAPSPESPSLTEWLARFALLPLAVVGIVLLKFIPVLAQKGIEYQWAMVACATVLLLFSFFVLAYLLQAANRRRLRVAGVPGAEPVMPRPTSPSERSFPFRMTPRQGYARHVGVPMLVLLGIWGVIVTVLIARSGTPQEWLILTLTGGLIILPLSFVVLTLRWALRRSSGVVRPTSHRATTSPTSAVPPSGFWHRRRRHGLIAMLALLVAAGVVYRFQFHIPSGKARLEIESDSEIHGVKILVKRAGQVVTVVQPETQGRVDLDPGIYELWPEGSWTGPGKLQVSRASLTLAAGERQQVRVALHRTEVERHTEAMLQRRDDELPLLQGRWTVVKQELGGQAVAPEGRRASVEWIEFEGNHMRQQPWGTETVLEKLFAIDSSKPSKQIDLFGTGAHGHEGTGIYQLDDDTLTLYINPPDDGRPASFSSNQGARRVLTVCRREKVDGPVSSEESPADGAPEVAWGEASAKRVQLGVALEPRKAAYTPSEVVTVRLTLRNAGPESISFAVPRLEVLEKFDFDLSLVDDTDSKLSWNWADAHKSRAEFTVSGAIELQLKPGQTYELPAAKIAVGREHAPPRDAIACLNVEPGQFCRLRCKLGTYGYARGQGEPLESGAVEFRVEARERVEPTTAAELDRLVELAEQELRRVQQLIEAKTAPPSAAAEAESKLIDARVRRARVHRDHKEAVTQLRRLVEIRNDERTRIDELVKAGVAPVSERADAERLLIEANLQLKEAEEAFERAQPDGSPAPSEPSSNSSATPATD